MLKTPNYKYEFTTLHALNYPSRAHQVYSISILILYSVTSNRDTSRGCSCLLWYIHIFPHSTIRATYFYILAHTYKNTFAFYAHNYLQSVRKITQLLGNNDGKATVFGVSVRSIANSNDQQRFGRNLLNQFVSRVKTYTQK